MKRIASVLLAVSCLSLSYAVASNEPRGSVLELHSCELYAGGCVISSEATLGGRYMLQAWNFSDGNFQGTPLAGLQVAYFYGQLPDVIASHFDGHGVPNGFMTRNAFIGFYVGMLAFVMILFGGIARLLKAMPTQLINIPNREYWFSPGQKDASRAWISGQLQSFGLAVALFLVVVMQLVFRANTGGTPARLPAEYIVPCLVALFGITGFLIVRMVRRFSRIP